jgi:hypothetical protein
MTVIADLGRSSLLIKLALFGGAFALLGWLAVSTNPSKHREWVLNALIERGELGKTDPALAKRLQLQFPWLARHAGVNIPVGINQPISRARLTLIVTTPHYEEFTHCGSGNALFDPSLNTIFVDQSLLWPTEVNIIGSPSVNSMFTINDYGYVVSYTNFILAHELGHWQKHQKASAFFYYGWGDGTANLAEEEQADRSAVATIFAARAAGDEPSELRKLDALSAIGLGSAQLTTRESAAGDILGGMILMTNDLLFSSSPFSPYYSNRSHPDMLDRADEAIRNIEATPPGAALRAETGLVQAELTRFAALGDWKHREIFFSGPLSTADVRAGSLWLGRTDIPTINTVKLEEQIERIPLTAFTTEWADSSFPISPSLVKIGYSKVGEEYGYAENYGTWVEREFKDGDPTIGLPPTEISRDPWLDSDWAYLYDFVLQNHWRPPKTGGEVWQWPPHGHKAGGEVSVRYLVARVQQLLPEKVVSLGRLQWRGETIVFPVVTKDAKSGTNLRLFQISPSAPLRLTECPEFRFSSSGSIDISGVKMWKGNLWVPVRIGEGEPGYRVELWRILPGEPRLFDTASFLVGQAGTNLETKRLNRLIPENPSLVPISGGRAVFGYENDSLYLVDERLGHLKLLFHPASAGLQMTDLGSGRIMFWNLHARKAYIIDTDRGKR